MNFRSILTTLAAVFFLVSCGSQSRVITTKKEQEQQQKDTDMGYGTVQQPPLPPPPVETTTEPKVTTPSGYAETVIKYIDLYSTTAKYEMKEHGIPASITLAQAILESGAGTSDIAMRANNHFGIKCAAGWEGEKITHKGECFRSYDNPRRSFGDHSLFLQRSHYRSLFSLPKDDYVSWAKGLQRAGYATDKKYPEKLINIIERYQLHKYDREVLSALQEESPVTEPANPEPAADPSVPTSYADIVAQYIEWYQATAKHEMEAYGIPASITLAQAILESGAGTSEVAVRAKNHFGIKCNAEWEGEKFYRDNECFRSYENARLSFRDHSLFLQRSHYRALFSLPKNDYKGWAKGLKEAGYASDSAYPEKLINLIERYQLHKYDREVLAANSQEKPSTPSPVEERYVVKPGDTLYSISRRYGITVEELMRMNSLEHTNIDVGQVLIVKRLK